MKLQSFFYDQNGGSRAETVLVWNFISMSQNQRCPNRPRRRNRKKYNGVEDEPLVQDLLWRYPDLGNNSIDMQNENN